MTRSTPTSERESARLNLARRIISAETIADLQHRSVSTLLLMGEVDAATQAARQAEAIDRHIEALRLELRSVV